MTEVEVTAVHILFPTNSQCQLSIIVFVQEKGIKHGVIKP